MSVASELRPQYVKSLKLVGNRIDAEVVLGATKVNVTVSDGHDDIAPAVAELLTKIITRARADLASQLEMDLSPSVRKALKP